MNLIFKNHNMKILFSATGGLKAWGCFSWAPSFHQNFALSREKSENFAKNYGM